MKDYRDKEMKNLMFILFFLFLIWCTPVLRHIKSTEEQSNYVILASILESTVISGILSSATLLCDCIISSEMKDKLVGLFLIPRSGETIFTRINSGKLKDNRFLNSEAKDKYKNIIESLPSSIDERRTYENANWYKIYQQYQEKGQVNQSQKDYLMCRDLYTEVLGFLIMYLLSLKLFPSTIIFSAKFLLLLCTLAVAFCFCTHLKMSRFANTVIAVDLATRKTDSTDTY